MDSRSRVLLGVVVLAVLASLGVVAFRTLVRHDFSVIEPAPAEEMNSEPVSSEPTLTDLKVEPVTP
jgi:hypothetical protein